ncbi:MAG: hypothetical protein K6A82_06120 [Prevotella sp.]|nr:hypothetical protein [Prevotella sp.]
MLWLRLVTGSSISLPSWINLTAKPLLEGATSQPDHIAGTGAGCAWRTLLRFRQLSSR